MPRTSRSVAQRLAAQNKSKKRRSPRTGTPPQEPSAGASPQEAPASGPSVAEILDEVVPSEGGSRADSMSAFGPAPTSTTTTTANRPASRGAARRTAAPRPAVRPAPTRRRYHEYAAEYQYVWTDLRRIVVVATVLIVLLVVLSFVLQ